MTLTQGLLWSLILTTAATADEVNLSWRWQSADGQQRLLQLHADEHALEASRREMLLLDASLNYPLETLYSYLGPRLYGSLDRINQSSPQGATKFHSLEQALALRDDSRESNQFWQAYQQYQEDAFYQMRVLPCIHPQDRKLPCVRPNYSQLFYRLKGDLRSLARQFLAEDLATSVRLIQEWLDTMPASPEQADHFAPPLQALQENHADSDERVLLMASLLAELAPQYRLSIVYPDISIGSVSPAWLAITTDSGLKGDTLLIDHQAQVLLTGSPQLAQQMTMSQIPLVSEPLY